MLKPRRVSEMMETAGVAAAIESVSGKIYVGVCVDGGCTLGICAERNAIFQMLTYGEDMIFWIDSRPGEGACVTIGGRIKQGRKGTRALRSLPGTDDPADAEGLPQDRSHAGHRKRMGRSSWRPNAQLVDLKCKNTRSTGKRGTGVWR